MGTISKAARGGLQFDDGVELKFGTAGASTLSHDGTKLTIAGDVDLTGNVTGVGGAYKYQTAVINHNDASGAIFAKPVGERWLIEHIWFETKLSWDGAGTVDIGVPADANGFLGIPNANLNTGVQERALAGLPTGTYGLSADKLGPLAYKNASNPYWNQKTIVEAGTDVETLIVVGGSTVGNGVAHIFYAVIS